MSEVYPRWTTDMSETQFTPADQAGRSKICTLPTVRVVAAPQFIENPEFPIPGDGTDGEKLGSYAGKRCYRSAGTNGRPNVENQRRIIEQRHGSVAAHVWYALDISGITRACSLELNRHDLNISQESTRYVDIEKNGRIVLEPYAAALYEKHLDHNIFWEARYWGFDGLGLALGLTTFLDETDKEALFIVEHINSQLAGMESYGRQVKQLMELNPNGLSGFDLRKWARGKARNALPHGLETAGVWSAGLRMWRNVIEQRSNRAAEPEVRRLATAIFQALEPFAPVYFADYTVDVVDGIPEYTTPHTKI